MIWIILISVACLYSGYYFAKVSLEPNTANYESTYHDEVAKGLIDPIYYDGLIKEEVYITSDFGYQLHGMWFPVENAVKTIIICHGYAYTLFGSVKYMRMFEQLGYNVLIYDHRGHGKSGGENCSMGYYEKYDLKKCVDWVEDRVGKNTLIGTHGESMGAATALMHAAIDDRLGFLIADCAFEDVYEQFKYRLKVEYKLPPFPFLTMANLFTKMKIKVFYKAISPIRVIKNVQTPILFIHGDSDAYIPCTHSQHLYDLKPGVKQLYFAKGADHACSFISNKENYERIIYQFLNSIS